MALRLRACAGLVLGVVALGRTADAGEPSLRTARGFAIAGVGESVPGGETLSLSFGVAVADRLYISLDPRFSSGRGSSVRSIGTNLRAYFGRATMFALGGGVRYRDARIRRTVETLFVDAHERAERNDLGPELSLGLVLPTTRVVVGFEFTGLFAPEPFSDRYVTRDDATGRVLHTREGDRSFGTEVTAQVYVGSVF